MDATALAATLLDIPANRLFGIEVLHTADARAEVCLTVRPEFTNVIGSLHSSGLIALVDAAGLAAIIGAVWAPEEFGGVTPLGTLAHLEFLAPARGRLVGRCALDPASIASLRGLLERRVAKAELATAVEIVDAAANVVCRGSFTWKLRRTIERCAR